MRRVVLALIKAFYLNRARLNWRSPEIAIGIMIRSRRISELTQVESLFLSLSYFSAQKFESALAELKVLPKLEKPNPRNQRFINAYREYLIAASSGDIEEAREAHKNAMILPKDEFLIKLFV